ncbi:hypothetical protein [Sphingomonas sp.]|uniref:hypothetical protein n=1 Tax=Sphingomonas sp. TaxID=28214 RepID=UPI003CC5E283
MSDIGWDAEEIKALGEQAWSIAGFSAAYRHTALFAVLVIVLLVFFRGPIGSELTRFYGDSYDGLIEISLLEHWYGVLARGDAWNVTGYFFPYADTLGYNDTDLVPGIPYALTRLLGGDPFVATLVAHMVMKAIGFVGMYVLLRRGMGIRWWLAIAGAATFATANASLLHMHHAQLLSVGLLPWLGFAAMQGWQGLVAGDRGRFLRWGLAVGGGYGLLAFNAFYAAWFFAFFVLILALVSLVATAPAWRRTLASSVRRLAAPLLIVTAAAIVSLVPLLLVYLPKLAAGARHDWELGAGRSLIGATGLLNVGSGNLVWGGVLDHGARILSGRPPLTGEARFGIPWGLLFLLGGAVVAAIRARRARPLEAAMATALVVSVLLMTRWPGGFSLWRYVYLTVPGADAVRVVSRFLLFALVPIVVIVFAYLDRVAWRRGVLMAVVAFLLVEEVQLAAPLAIDRSREMAMLRDVVPPPAACRVVAVVSARRSTASTMAEATRISAMWNNEPPGMLADNYRHNVDAMLIAVYRGWPTINGFSSFNPPDAVFYAPDSPSYLERVERYARGHRLTGLCMLDRRRAQPWSPVATAGPAPAGPDRPAA